MCLSYSKGFSAVDKFTLMAANAVILIVFSVAYIAAFWDMKRARYWRTWTLANLAFATSLLAYIFAAVQPGIWVSLASNSLALIGFSLYWNAARQFGGCEFCRAHVWLPLTILAVTSLLTITMNNPGLTYCVTNLMLAVLAFRTAREYAGMKGDRFSSRHGLAFANAFIGISFSIQAIQGLVSGHYMATGPANDILLPFHLIVILVYVSTGGAFSLAIAYERAVTEQREAAHRDPLTGVYNRREFELRLKALLAEQSRVPFALLQFDLDHFKGVNDRFGHVAGDEALQLCADIIKWHLRDDDCLARLGGEEFAALLPDISKEEAIRIAETIRRSVADTRLDFAPSDFRMTLSAGVYQGTGHELTHKALMRCVDRGLYRSKNSGRNRVCIAEAA